jgi:CheY-like chemotaxis protein
MNKKHVLVVDDHFINQELMKDMLERLGCEVDLAENGKDALDAMENQKFDMIFMDLQMPVMDGFEAAHAIRNKEGLGRLTPIIALTASGLTADKIRCRESGMDECLDKPIVLSDIEQILRRFF